MRKPNTMYHCMWRLKYETNEPIYEMQTDSQTQRTDLWLPRGRRSGEGWSGRQRESEVAQSCLTLCNPRTVAYQTPPSMGFSRQESWSGLPFPPPGDLPNPVIESSLSHCRQMLYRLSPQGSPGSGRLGLANVSFCI